MKISAADRAWPAVDHPAGAVCMSLGDVQAWAQINLRGLQGVDSPALKASSFVKLHTPVGTPPGQGGYGLGWAVAIDGQGHRWTILAVKLATLGARWRCEARNVAIAVGLDDTISVQRNVGSVSSPTWQTWKTGVRARVQSVKTAIASDADPPSTTTQYRIFVEENLVLDHNCRIRGADGAVYVITGSSGADRIGELQVIEAEISR